MAYFSLKQSPCRLSGGLPVQRRSPLPAVRSLPSKNHTMKPLHLSSSPSNAFSYPPTAFPHRDLSCPFSAEPSPVPAPMTNILDFLFFKPEPYEPYHLIRWPIKIILTVYSYAAYTFTSKLLLNSFPCPWLLSTIYFAAGILFMHISWTFGFFDYDRPRIDRQFLTSLLPVAAVYTAGVVAEMVCLSQMSAVSTHIMRCVEPVFMVLLSVLLGGESFPMTVYISLGTIVTGCALAAMTDHNINLTGFITVMIANFAFALANILSEKQMNDNKGLKETSVQYYGLLSFLCLLIVAPFALAIEGPRMWVANWKTGVSKTSLGAMIWMIFTISVVYHMYNEEEYRFFPTIQPFPFLTVNTMKKMFAIYCSAVYLHTPLHPMSALGAAVAIFGIFLYSRELCKLSRIQSWYL